MSEALTSLKQKHLVSGTIRRSDGVQARVVSAAPPHPKAQTAILRLEDAYLYLMSDRRQEMPA